MKGLNPPLKLFCTDNYFEHGVQVFGQVHSTGEKCKTIFIVSKVVEFDDLEENEFFGCSAPNTYVL